MAHVSRRGEELWQERTEKVGRGLGEAMLWKAVLREDDRCGVLEVLRGHLLETLAAQGVASGSCDGRGDRVALRRREEGVGLCDHGEDWRRGVTAALANGRVARARHVVVVLAAPLQHEDAGESRVQRRVVEARGDHAALGFSRQKQPRAGSEDARTRLELETPQQAEQLSPPELEDARIVPARAGASDAPLGTECEGGMRFATAALAYERHCCGWERIASASDE